MRGRGISGIYARCWDLLRIVPVRALSSAVAPRLCGGWDLPWIRNAVLPACGGAFSRASAEYRHTAGRTPAEYTHIHGGFRRSTRTYTEHSDEYMRIHGVLRSSTHIHGAFGGVHAHTRRITVEYMRIPGVFRRSALPPTCVLHSCGACIPARCGIRKHNRAALSDSPAVLCVLGGGWLSVT